jgi:hypothetical protein
MVQAVPSTRDRTRAHSIQPFLIAMATAPDRV